MSIEAPLPPQNLEAEESLLGAMMVSEAVLEPVLYDVRVAAEDFYRDRHGKIFSAISALYSRDQPVDALTVSEELRTMGLLDDVGGKERVATLASTTPAPGNAAHYASIVAELARLRRALRFSQGIQAEIFGRAADSTEIAERIEQHALELLNPQSEQTLRPPAELLEATVERLERRLAGRQDEGTSSGFPILDRKLHGLQPGRMIVLAARPGHGKSTLALNIAEHVARLEGKAVAFFSLEMSTDELMDKLLIARSGVDADRYSGGKLKEGEHEKVLAAANLIDGVPLYLDDTSAISLAQIRSRARRLAARERERGGLGLLVVDYLQLIDPPRRTRDTNRVAEVSEISRGLKILAGELQVPLLVCAQVNRAPEMRTDKRAVLADLRESGGIESDANQVIFLYNAGVYEELPEDPDEEPGLVEANVAKNRHGSTGVIRLSFQGEHSRFLSPAPVGVGER